MQTKFVRHWLAMGFVFLIDLAAKRQLGHIESAPHVGGFEPLAQVGNIAKKAKHGRDREPSGELIGAIA